MWVFKHAAQEPLEHAAKPALQGLLMLLDNGATSSLCIPLSGRKRYQYRCMPKRFLANGDEVLRIGLCPEM